MIDAIRNMTIYNQISKSATTLATVHTHTHTINLLKKIKKSKYKITRELNSNIWKNSRAFLWFIKKLQKTM